MKRHWEFRVETYGDRTALVARVVEERKRVAEERRARRVPILPRCTGSDINSSTRVFV